jgi:hypothetical protein
MKKVEIIEACFGDGFAYNKGVHSVPDDLARELLRAGLAKPYKQKPERSVTVKGKKRGVSKTDNGTKL